MPANWGRQTRHPLLLRIWFGAHLPNARLQAMVLAHQTRQSIELARFRALLRHADELRAAKARPEASDNGLFRRLAIRHAIVRLEAQQTWLDEVIWSLGKRRDPQER